MCGQHNQAYVERATASSLPTTLLYVVVVLASSEWAERGETVVGVVDADDVRRIAMSLPHTVEIDSDGFDFRVGNRGFVWSYPEYIPGRRRVIRSDIAVLYGAMRGRNKRCCSANRRCSSPPPPTTGHRW